MHRRPARGGDRAPALAGVTVRLGIVLDACSDRSGDVAERGAARPAARESSSAPSGRPGGARRRGRGRLLRRRRGARPGAIWIATTDADTRVPPDWLALQLAAADRAGADAVAGIVEVDDWQRAAAARPRPVSRPLREPRHRRRPRARPRRQPRRPRPALAARRRHAEPRAGRGPRARSIGWRRPGRRSSAPATFSCARVRAARPAPRAGSAICSGRSAEPTSHRRRPPAD